MEMVVQNGWTRPGRVAKTLTCCQQRQQRIAKMPAFHLASLQLKTLMDYADFLCVR